jgi:hypothetical protein
MRTFVTAASSNHFKSVCQFLETIRGERTYFYDIGLSSDESKQLRERFQVEYRVFPFERYPSFVSLASQDAGAYAWKPIIIADVYQEVNGVLIWCDGGNKIHNVEQLTHAIKENGIYTPTSSGTIARWTHPTALTTMNVPPGWHEFNMRNAACIGFVKSPISDMFIKEWRETALNKDASIPDGANRSNHRWDQSILTYLYYKYNVRRVDDYLGFSIHNDID